MRHRTVLITTVLLSLLSAPCPAQEKTFRVEVLQATAIQELKEVCDGFLGELEKNGLVQGRNLQVKRTVIDFDMEKDTWSAKLKAYWRIRGEAARIAGEKPDLVLTMGMPVTYYARDRIVAAGIPLVFTAVADPVRIGCRSLTEAGTGFTGSTSRMDMKDALKLVRAALPEVRTLGLVHSEYSGSSNHVEDALKESRAEGFTFVVRKVKMNASITPLLRELKDAGAQAFVVPSDPYYGVRNYEAAKELARFSKEEKIPVVSFVEDKFKGSVLDVFVDFGRIGALAGAQAVKILKEGAQPGSLPVLCQQAPTVLLNAKNARSLGIELPPALLKTGRTCE